jgi:hypothetical protein
MLVRVLCVNLQQDLRFMARATIMLPQKSFVSGGPAWARQQTVLDVDPDAHPWLVTSCPDNRGG